MKTIKIKYDIDEKVFIPEFDINGKISQVSYDRSGIQYQVRYFFNGEMKFFWVNENDITPKADSDVVGFMAN